MLQSLVPQWLTTLKVEEGKAEGTLHTYRMRSNKYFQWPEHAQDPVHITPQHLRQYVFHLSSLKLQPRSLKACIDAVKSFCRWLVREGYLPTDPSAGVRVPKLNPARRLTVNDEQVIELLKACARLRTDKRCAMASAILGCMIYGGMRRSEVLALTVEDVDFANKSVLIAKAKGNKSRRIYPYDDLMKSLKEWLRLRGTVSHNYLFSFYDNRMAGSTALMHMMEEIRNIAGYRGNKAVLPHSLRHWCATNLWRNGYDIESLRRFLGHSNVATTMIYVHSGEEDLRPKADLGQIHSLKVKHDYTNHTQPNQEIQRTVKQADPVKTRRRVALR